MRFPQKITPCLWFDDQAEEAVAWYTGVFPGSRVTDISRYGKEGYEIHGHPAGSVMALSFELAGQSFMALNGGPLFRFTEAISLQIHCQSQEEVDHYWERLTEGGDPAAQQCGWLKDKFGLSWQVVPDELMDRLADPDPARAGRAMTAMLQMKKIDLAALRRAVEG